jgi:hypothetical protein
MDMNPRERLLLLAVAVLVGVVLAASTAPAAAHGGGLDAIGGHRDNKAGNYHVHRGSCAGRTFGSKDKAVKAGCKR